MPPDPPRLMGLMAPCSYSRLFFFSQLPTSNFIEIPELVYRIWWYVRIIHHDFLSSHPSFEGFSSVLISHEINNWEWMHNSFIYLIKTKCCRRHTNEHINGILDQSIEGNHIATQRRRFHYVWHLTNYRVIQCIKHCRTCFWEIRLFI